MAEMRGRKELRQGIRWRNGRHEGVKARHHMAGRETGRSQIKAPFGRMRDRKEPSQGIDRMAEVNSRHTEGRRRRIEEGLCLSKG